MVEKSKYCSDVMKKQFSKELVINKKDNEDFKNTAKCWICNNYCVDGNVKVTDHCYVTGEYEHSHFNINLSEIKKLKINSKLNLKYYDSHLTM